MRFDRIVGSAVRHLIGWLTDLEAVGAYGPPYRFSMLFSGAASTLIVWWRDESLRLGVSWTIGGTRQFLKLALPLAVIGGLSSGGRSPGSSRGWSIILTATWRLSSGGYSCRGWLDRVERAAGSGTSASVVEPEAVAWTIAAVVNGGLNRLTIPRFGLAGAAAGSAWWIEESTTAIVPTKNDRKILWTMEELAIHERSHALV